MNHSNTDQIVTNPLYTLHSQTLQELYDHCAGTNWQEQQPQTHFQSIPQRSDRFNINVERLDIVNSLSDHLEGQSERYENLKGDSLMSAIFIDSIQCLAL